MVAVTGYTPIQFAQYVPNQGSAHDWGGVARYPEFDGSEVCAQVDPEIWFPTATNQTGAMAKKFCLSCPWLTKCRDYAVQVDVVGIWGATNEKERSRIRKKNKMKVERLELDGVILAIRKAGA